MLFLLTLMLLPFQTPAASSEKIVKELITSQNKKRAFYLFVPDSVKSGTPAPLIVLLHGSGRNGFTLVDKWKDLAAKEGIIVVGPDSLDPSVWSSPVDGPDFLRDLVEDIKSKYTINPRRVYLFGHSGGAVFALYLSLLESQYFAAAAIHAGAIARQDPAIGVAQTEESDSHLRRHKGSILPFGSRARHSRRFKQTGLRCGTYRDARPRSQLLWPRYEDQSKRVGVSEEAPIE